MFGFLKSAKEQTTLAQAYPVLPMSQDGYQTNNQYSQFPPITEDGRNITASWQPGAVVNESILKKEGIQSNWQYRQFMTSNADQLRQNMYREALNDVGFTIRNENTTIDKATFGTPKLYGSLMEPTTEGSLSDLKANYLSREQLASRMVVPELTQAQLQQMKPK